jgi:hypothetical protein
MFAVGLKGAARIDGVTLEVAGRSNANVSLASHEEIVAAVWSASLPEGTTDVFAAVSRDRGRTFSTPTRVNSTPGDARVNGEQPPRVALIRRRGGPPSMAVVWTSKSAVGSTLVSARSDDGGRTFGASTLVPHGEAAGNRGWHSVTVDATGQVRVLWLDHRELASTRAKEGATHERHSGHDAARPTHDSAVAARPPHDGVAMAERSKLYFATIGDETSARSVVGGVCYCCKTALTTAPDGTIYSAWRRVYPGNLRDIAFAASRDGGRTFGQPVRVSEDRWALNGCPDDGPAMAVDARGTVHVAWPTLVGDAPDGKPSIGVFYARSVDGRAFGPRVRLPTEGVPHHPQIARSGGALYLAWDELTGASRQVVVAERPASEAPDAPFVRTVLGAGAPGVYPSIIAAGRGVIVAWTSSIPDGAVIRVARIPAR